MYRLCCILIVSLLDDDVPEHLEVLGIGLFVVDLVVVAHEAMDNREEDHVGSSNGRHSDRVSALDKVHAASAAAEISACSYDCWNSSNQGSESGLGLPYAETFMIIEEVWLLLNCVCLLVSKKLSEFLLPEEKSVNFCKGAGVLSPEEEA